MLKFNNRRIAEFNQRITAEVKQALLDDSEQDTYKQHSANIIPLAVFKPSGLLRNSKLIGMAFTDNEMKRLMKRKGIVKPYISPYGNGVLALADDTAEKLSEQYGIFDVLLKYDAPDKKEVDIIHDVDKEPTFNVGVDVSIDKQLIARWMSTHVDAVNELLDSAASPKARINKKYFVVAELYARYKSTSARVRRTMENITSMLGEDASDKKALKKTARTIVNYNKNSLLLISSLELKLHTFIHSTLHEETTTEELHTIVKEFIKEVIETQAMIY